MRIHHLNCISTCPLGGALMDGHSTSLRGRLACHCLLVEANNTLVLIDTGFGLRDVADPRSRLSRFFLTLLSPDFREEFTAIRQIAALGYDPRDVRHIVLTHLDFDHAGGLDDFPHARVHMMSKEREVAEAQRTMLDRMRYRPQQWSRRDQWVIYPALSGERWYDFECVRELQGVPPEILLVPLVGHTLGHAGVAVERTGGSWVLQAGDAYFYHAEMDVERPRCTPGLRFYQWMMEQDRPARLHNQQRLRDLKRKHAKAVRIVSSHDVVEFEGTVHRASGALPARPVRA
ncbi:MBL fold metallo-hydrolase [Peristeroidobacter agariperforans]|uniref:MBL fold metallo-hydrolase n=1 Tax=Peristeroidobacter agariperforans TaxID=268404 RepID=UPI00101C5276